MAHYEIEIKTLLGERAAVDVLKEAMHERDPACTRVGANTQLNHYFTGGDIENLYTKVEHLFAVGARERLRSIVEKGTDFSIRTRQKDDEVLLVVKASVDAGTSANAVSRLEFEEPVSVTLGELDELLLAAGFSYQAKWSREREEYAYKGATVCIDRNAGYGYLAEFERVAEEGEDIAAVRTELEALMAELGLAELPQDRLERMFAHYNANWPEYYGTKKTFVIE